MRIRNLADVEDLGRISECFENGGFHGRSVVGCRQETVKDGT
jgi:hypothetical protein